jgi:hypothetical protein
MSIEKQLTPGRATHSNALSMMLLQTDGSPSSVTAFPVSAGTEQTLQEDPAALSLMTAREALRQALHRHQEPILMPLEYLQQFCQDEDLVEHASNQKDILVSDNVLGQKFRVVPTTDVNSHVELHHANMQRVFGYCDDPSYLVLEDLPKGRVSSYLENNKGRVQLGAQRRIQIMLNVAQVLLSLDGRKVNLSSSNIGLTLDLTPKVMRSSFAGSDDTIQHFGILMIELLTGTLQNSQSQDNHYGDFVVRYTTKGGPIIEDDLDAYVRESWTFNILSQLVELAQSCISLDPKKRPSPAKLAETLSLVSARMQVVENYDLYM